VGSGVGSAVADGVELAAVAQGDLAGLVDAVVSGEIGGGMEEAAADYVAGMSKPVVAFIAGRSAPPETRMGHAGAIVTGDKSTGRSKVAALTSAGATVVDVPSQVGEALRASGVGGGEVSRQYRDTQRRVTNVSSSATACPAGPARSRTQERE